MTLASWYPYPCVALPLSVCWTSIHFWWREYSRIDRLSIPELGYKRTMASAPHLLLLLFSFSVLGTLALKEATSHSVSNPMERTMCQWDNSSSSWQGPLTCQQPCEWSQNQILSRSGLELKAAPGSTFNVTCERLWVKGIQLSCTWISNPQKWR